MKKLLSVLLAAALLIGVTLPASAAQAEDFEPPLWSEYGYSSLEEMLTDWNITEDEYDTYVDEQREWQEREDWTDAQWDDYFKSQFAEEKEKLGLIYDVNVMMNNTPLTFTDAVPEIVNSRVMVPLRAIMENLGAEVSYDAESKTALITAGDKTLEFTLGDSSFTVCEGDDCDVLTLDTEPYMKDGRIFVPVRFVAEALGYDVKWSDYYKTAVFLDKDSIIDTLNQNFTIANKVFTMANDMDLTATYKGNSSLDVKVTSLDSINGDKIYTGGIDAVVLQNGTSMKMTIDMDLNALIDLAEQYGGAIVDDEDELTFLIQILQTATDKSTEIIMDLDSGMLYIRSALIPLALEKLAGVELDDDSWISVDMKLENMGFDYDDYLDTMDHYKDMTFGDLIYEQYVNSWYDCVFAYDYIMGDTGYTSMLGDDLFRKTGSGYAYDYEQTDDQSGSSVDLHADLVMNSEKLSRIKGSLAASMDSNGITALADIDFNYSATDAKISGTFHVKNAFIVEFTLTSSVEERQLTVPTQPPLSDSVITLEELEAMLNAA
ncbi:MAG: copper amine oxidase N-terminal domain-containing protein [Oscillospiraceae bacterium]